jgi:hypothetical protein
VVEKSFYKAHGTFLVISGIAKSKSQPRDHTERQQAAEQGPGQSPQCRTQPVPERTRKQTGKMTRSRLPLLCLLALGIWSYALQAATPPEKPIFDRDWIAGSSTAMGVTGDMRMTPDSITFDGRVTYRLRFIEEKKSQQPESYWRNIPSFSLYEVMESRPQTILRNNSICGGMNAASGSPRYFAIGQDAVNQQLTVIAFQTEGPPADISFKVKGACGEYGYFLDMPAKK